jgi:RNA polymerase sigma factor (sigma-70 family)
VFRARLSITIMGELRVQPYLSASGSEPAGGIQNNVMWRSRNKELEQQYEGLMNDFGPALFRLAASYESRADAREDLLQDIRLALWTALSGFRGECSLRTFVYRIAHNRGLSHAYKRRRQLQGADEPGEIVDVKSDPESAAIENGMRERLTGAIRSLPLPYRQVITMMLDNLPYAEISQILGISESNVAVRLNRARAMLREKLGQLR